MRRRPRRGATRDKQAAAETTGAVARPPSGRRYPSSMVQRLARMRSGKTRFLKKMPKSAGGRPAIIGGRSEALSADGRAMRLPGSSRLRPSLWGPRRGLPRPGALQLHGPRPPGPSTKILSFSLWSRGTNRRPPTGPVRQGGRAIGLRGSGWPRPRQLGRSRGLPSAGGPQLHGPKAGRERAPKFSNFSKYLRLSRNPRECVPDFEGPAPRPAPESVEEGQKRFGNGKSLSLPAGSANNDKIIHNSLRSGRCRSAG